MYQFTFTVISFYVELIALIFWWAMAFLLIVWIRNELLDIPIPQYVLFVNTIHALFIVTLLAEAEQRCTTLLINGMKNFFKYVEALCLLKNKCDEIRS